MTRRQLFVLFLVLVWGFLIAGVVTAFTNPKRGAVLTLIGLMLMPVYREMKKRLK